MSRTGVSDPRTAPTVREATGAPAAHSGFEGYRVLDVLGTGGMGEVLLAEDLTLGREVAIKRMRSRTPSEAAVARFLREVKIQARLDHPAIVPIHELGRDPQGLPYFIMKRVTGVTLASRLDNGHGGRAQLLQLLRAFVEVCQAMELAHARGVIHRDLKPSNIMLGDYGEVYVIDWGVASAVGELELARSEEAGAKFSTRAGAVLGTPGYSSPEQLRGQVVTASTDVYALGAILFEMLAGEPLHRLGVPMPPDEQELERSPAVRAPARTIAPELDAICSRALATADTRPTAREVAHAVQLYLDGDRDLELRRSIASTHLGAARAHLASLETSRRAAAMGEAGRALALMPDSREASDLVGHLLLAPPTELPVALERRIASRSLEHSVAQSRLASYALLAYIVCVPVAMGARVTSWPIAGVFVALSLALVVLARYNTSHGLSKIHWSVIGNACIVALCSRFFGPFVVVPGLAAALAITFMVFPPLGRRPWLVMGSLVAGFLVPIVLEGLGWIASTWSFQGGALVSHPVALYLEGAGGLTFLVLVNLAVIVVVSLLARKFGASQRLAHRQLEVWAWHLEQLLPAAHEHPRSSVLHGELLLQGDAVDA